MYFGLMPITDSLPGTEDQPGARIALEAALASDEHLSHAYLFHGPPGTGKRTAARAFAAALLSRDVPDPADAERRVLKGVHPDLTWVERSRQRAASSTSIRRTVPDDREATWSARWCAIR